MATPATQRMSWEEKLRTLEELWDSITREGDRYESPAWHEQELKETQARVESGAEQPMAGPTPNDSSMQLRILLSAFDDRSISRSRAQRAALPGRSSGN